MKRSTRSSRALLAAIGLLDLGLGASAASIPALVARNNDTAGAGLGSSTLLLIEKTLNSTATLRCVPRAEDVGGGADVI